MQEYEDVTGEKLNQEDGILTKVEKVFGYLPQEAYDGTYKFWTDHLENRDKKVENLKENEPVGHDALYFKLEASKIGAQFVGDVYGDLAKSGVEEAQWAAITGAVTKASSLCKKLHGHHTYPKAIGGHPKQVLADIIDDLHIGKGGIHSDLAKFEGGWLRPRMGMTGKQIVEEFGQGAVEEGLRRFYSQDKYKHLLEIFENAVEFTHKMSSK